MREIGGRRVAETGIFQSQRGLRIAAIQMLIISLLAIVMVHYLFWMNGIYDQIMPLVLITSLLAIFPMLATYNIILSSRLNSADFKEVKIREIMILGSVDKYTKYAALAEYECETDNIPEHDKRESP